MVCLLCLLTDFKGNHHHALHPSDAQFEFVEEANFSLERLRVHFAVLRFT